MQDISGEIVRKAQGGDLEAFENIYKAASGFVYNVALRVVNNAQDAEEVTQDVFLNIHRHLRDFRFQCSFKTWAYRIAVNCAVNRVKSVIREKSRKKEYGNELVRAGKTIQGGEPGGASRDREETVASLLDLLDVDQRACLVLRGIEGLSYKEIAGVLKVNINTVRTRLKRSREKLLQSGKKVIDDGLREN